MDYANPATAQFEIDALLRNRTATRESKAQMENSLIALRLLKAIKIDVEIGRSRSPLVLSQAPKILPIWINIRAKRLRK